jgi:tetratricopeptide (TPR) repeat protein
MLAALATASVLDASSAPSGFAWDFRSMESFETGSKVFQLCNDADALSNSGSYAQALTLFRQAAAYDRTAYWQHVHVGMADCYRHLKQYPQAIQECETVMKADPNYCEAYYTIALTYYDYEHYDTAAQYIRKLLQVSHDQSWAQTANKFLAQIETYGNVKAASKEIAAGHLDKAREYLSEAARYDPSEVSGCVHANLAYVARESGKPEQAIEEDKKALRYTPDDKIAVYGMAISYQDIGKFDDAVGCLQRYLTMERDPEKVKLARELIRNLMDDKDKVNDPK